MAAFTQVHLQQHLQVMSLHSTEYTTLANCASMIKRKLEVLDVEFLHRLHNARLIRQDLYEDILSPRCMLTVKAKAGEIVKVQWN